MPKPEQNADQEALEAELQNIGTTGGGKPAEGKPDDTAPAADKGKAAEPAKKPEQGKPAAGSDEDPEIDLSKFGLGKVKKSDVEKWKKSGMLEEDYRKKTEELSQREAQVKELLELSEYLGKNPNKLKKVLAVLDEKDEIIADVKSGEITPKEAKDQASEAQAKIAKILESIDPEDPAAVLLKTMYQEMAEIKKAVKYFQERETKLQEQEQQGEVARAKEYAQGLLKKTFEGLEKELEFETDEEKGPWKAMVLSHLKNNPKQYASEEDFVKAIKDAGAKIFKQIRAIAEANLKKQLEKGKGPKLPGPGGSGDVQPEKPTMENLNETLVKELEAMNK